MIFGKYQLLDLLGRGGMAEVFKAKSYGVEGFEKMLVIKRILPNLTDNERFVDMFINEAKIAVSLNHANIVQVFDLGKVGDSYYIAMEYVHGMDLASIIKACQRNNRSVPVELASFIGSEIAKGLDYAHRRRDQNLEPLNIIHRDISPHNVLVSFEGEVKITDFGIAKAKNTLAESEKGTIKGKYAYMAPEQARGKEHDKRVDIFSLGVLLYETVAGTNPLRGGSSSDVLKRIETRDYLPVGEAKSDVPGELEEIIGHAMEPEARKRYGGAGEFYESLIAFLYNTRTRVGAHTLSTFLAELAEEDQRRPSATDSAHLMRDFGGGTGTASSTGTGTGTDESSEITSIQVPTTVQMDDTTTTTTTGTRSLAAEFREVTIVAMEFIGPPTPAAALERLRAIVINNGGSIVEERSDILVGVFGLDVPDGRDTQDAIDTALKLQRATLMDEATVALQIGIGVHPAKVVLMANGQLREDDAFFNAVSDARGLAKRGIGWVTTDDVGRQLASQYFRFEDVTVTSVEGSQQMVCKVTGRRPVAESYGRLFGRRDELRTIGEVLAMVSRGTGRVMELVGEAGTGKTRIVHEVRRRLVAGGHDVGWYEAACMPWRHATPFAAVIAMFRSILGVGEIEPEHELRTKVERLRELGLIPEEVESVSVLLGASVEHEDVGPEERGRQLRSALVRAASSLCTDKMTVFFWDDISYVDQESFEIIRYLSESLRRMPLLMILASRTGADFNLADSPVCQRIGLNPLSEADSKRLALSRIHTRRAPEDLLIDIALKSGGNPLYVEEYVKALIAGGNVKVRGGEAIYRAEAGTVDFPKTLRGLVGARIKRLPVEQRALLQQAAVLGHRFNLEIFSSVTGVELGELRAVLLGLKEVGLLTRISATDFAFASDLVRDVVYDGIIISDRRDIHAAVAHALEEKFSDRIDEFVEKLAVHYREGGDRNKAVEFLIRAGEKVAASFSHNAALDYYLKALELLQNVPRPDLDKVLAVYLPIGELCIKTNQLDLGAKKMRLAEELAEDTKDRERLIKIMRTNAELQARSEHYLESQQYFKRAIELADESGDEEMRCEVRITAGQVYIWLGDMKKAAPFYREALKFSAASSKPELFIMSSAQLAKAEAMSEEAQQALETLDKAKLMLDHTINPATRCEFELAHSYVYYMMRDMDQAVHYNLRALEIAREYDIKDQIARNAHNIGDAYLGLGNYRKAFTYLRMSDEMAEEIGHELLGNLNNIFLAFIDALKFESNEGLTKLEKALARAMERNTVWEQVQVHYFLGRIHFERSQYDVARSHLEQTIRIGRAADNRVYDAPAADLLAQIVEIEG